MLLTEMNEAAIVPAQVFLCLNIRDRLLIYLHIKSWECLEQSSKMNLVSCILESYPGTCHLPRRALIHVGKALVNARVDVVLQVAGNDCHMQYLHVCDSL